MSTDPFDITATGEYVPEPERDTALIVDGLFADLARFAREHGYHGDPIPELHARLIELEAADAARVIDEPARYNLRMTLALIVGYRFLLPFVGATASSAVVRRAFVEPVGEAVRESTRMLLDTAADPFAVMVATVRAREEHAFGRGFVFEHPVDDDTSYHSDVRHCFYYEVLVAHDAAELAPTMCEFDTNWITAIDPDRHGFRFERATTIGRGGTHCPFHFDRTINRGPDPEDPVSTPR
ncbi:L-2-amino-thiazoline-4-carboxylic acid hydrolase [Nocardia fusca]|uniref:L-2-amino-thiazoline-4-carboxylic acid hydrolase n=1 Tax=Nocardia fusca TaxID=941183 RepID=A0ABV3F7I6_9NOCA